MGKLITYCRNNEKMILIDHFDDILNGLNNNTMIILALSRQFSGLDKYDYLLNSNEKQQLALLHMQVSKNNFRLGHLIIRIIAAVYLGIPTPEIDIIQEDDNSKPFLRKKNSTESLHFNISHCSDMVTVAFSNKSPLGIDIEKVRSNADIELIAKSYFTVKEQKIIFTNPNPGNVFFEYWTRKESIIKLMGGMLLQLIKNVEVITGINENKLIDFKDETEIHTQTYLPQSCYPLSISHYTFQPDILFYMLQPQDIKSWFTQ
jgi:4'-phosphopantetheinyl transferase